jgi:hypothetical protein
MPSQEKGLQERLFLLQTNPKTRDIIPSHFCLTHAVPKESLGDPTIRFTPIPPQRPS